VLAIAIVCSFAIGQALIPKNKASPD
jgi:hypothetical protein